MVYAMVSGKVSVTGEETLPTEAGDGLRQGVSGAWLQGRLQSPTHW